MTSVGEVVIARAHVTVSPRLRDAETRRVAGGWGVVKLSLQVITAVTSFDELKIQVSGRQIGRIDYLKGNAAASFRLERHVGAT